MSTDDPILHALSELPRERAGEGFTTRVVARATSEPEPSRGAWSRGAVAAAAALVLVSGASAWRLERARRLESFRGEVQDLQSEHRRITQELRDLRAAEKPPVVYLGTDGKVDLYIDLDELQRLQATARATAEQKRTQPTGGTI